MKKREAVIFLQNAWAREPLPQWLVDARDDKHWGREVPMWYREKVEWPRRSWLYATAKCRTGQMLKRMYPDLFEDYDQPRIWLDDSTPKCGIGHSNIQLPPDPDYITRVIGMLDPDYVVTCGVHAREAVRKVWPGPMIMLPHPAYRMVTNALFAHAGTVANRGIFGRLRIDQGIGDIRHIEESDHVNAG